MKGKLSLKLVDDGQQHSKYDWMNIDYEGCRVGKIRGKMGDRCLTIYSINIFPEYEKRGYARKIIEMFKERFDAIIADRVRFKAIGFWEKMDFKPQDDGNYIWNKFS